VSLDAGGKKKKKNRIKELKRKTAGKRRTNDMEEGIERRKGK